MILFENVDLLIIIGILVMLSVASISMAIVAFFKYSSLNKKYEMFMSGRDAESLEQFFLDIQADIDHLMEDNKKNKENIRSINRIARQSYQKIGLHRYDAFEEKSGKRSFALAMLDYTNTGFVITCQNIGTGTLIFIKEVDAGTTSVKLGPEEEKALMKAMGQKDED